MKSVGNNNESKELIVLKKTNILKYLHIAVILIGSIFILFPCFHTNVWFDESYSVAISNHTFSEIWNIGSYDVHPVLYYILLKIVGIFTNQSILAYRLFSALPLIILSVLGFTHIKKDFEEKTGFLFSFLILFMPVTLVYAGEIRMYTWAMLFVTLTALYAYRIYRSGVSNKNWIIFTIFSLASAYTHYYGLITVAIINIALFIYFLINNIKQRNYEVKYVKYSGNLKRSIISAIVQILLYIPWLSILLSQFKSVSNGFWIGFPNIPEMFIFQFTGSLGNWEYLSKIVAYIFSIALSLYMLYLYVKYHKNIKPARFAIKLYLSVIIIIAIISLIEPILYARYLLNLTGIFLFALAFLMAEDKNKLRVNIICIIILLVSAIVNFNLIKINYDETNSKPIEFIEDRIKEDDIFISDNKGSGFSAYVHFMDNKFYFYDLEHWNVEEAYKAFGDTIYNLDALEEYKGRIWIITANGDNLLNNVKENLSGEIEVLENRKFDIKYQNYQFAISLIERK